MPIEIQRARSKWFYGRTILNGRKLCVRLNVRIEGNPPPTLKETGDALFERSRARAQVAFEQWEASVKSRGNTEELLQRILEVRTGERMRSLSLKEMAARWEALPRKRKIRESYSAQAIVMIGRFVTFLRENYPKVTEMAAVTDAMAAEYMKRQEERGISPKRYTDILKLLRSCFGRLKKEAGLAGNPFEDIPEKEAETIHRKPFSADELTEIIAAAKKVPEIYPLIVIAVTTAMRRGDCARLSWEQIDLDRGFIDVKTAKTKKPVTIPIFPMLYALLSSQPRKAKGFVFPELAKTYALVPDRLTDLVRKVMTSVGFGDASNSDGSSLETRGEFHQHREHGLRRASIRDVHSLRVSWVTLAINAGVPVNLVMKVTGHATLRIVDQHYHQPDREDFRRELSMKLPQALTGGPDKQVLSFTAVREKLVAMTDSNWQTIRDDLLVTIAKQV